MQSKVYKSKWYERYSRISIHYSLYHYLLELNKIVKYIIKFGSRRKYVKQVSQIRLYSIKQTFPSLGTIYIHSIGFLWFPFLHIKLFYITRIVFKWLILFRVYINLFSKNDFCLTLVHLLVLSGFQKKMLHALYKLFKEHLK